MKKAITITLIISLLALTAVCAYAANASNEISSSVVRLHIIANNDSDADQQVKLQIRDAVISSMRSKLENVTDIKTAEQIITDNKDYILQTANDILKANNFDYSADLMLGNFDFPAKQYDNITLPSGNYRAVRIVLGKGEGHNWWCVMFPPLCFVNGTTGNAQLKNSMSADSYDIISSGSEKADVELKFKLVEWWNSL